LSSCLLAFFALTLPASPAEILAAAASDLVPLDAPLRHLFQEDTGHTVRFVFGSSGMLARQIENGAPYDVYLAANERFARDLAAQGKVDPASVAVYALGRVAVWSKSGRFGSLADLRAARRIALPNPAHAPYGVAGRQALEREGLWAGLEGRIVYGENVRQALQYAESGMWMPCSRLVAGS
jgi:molybdate transport system substrate-binding protein